ncbi:MULTISPECIES: phosphoglucomutase (alpha-D-glucose-1,6-bisphosphate-dependent) [Desulfovibrio]|uniref:phosphoglucomutase (alpha-D-glucose-1,6-bisphosphate-dependent) n=1 Tax=Desulfovibrio TaxID=872 RepID=UPI0026F36785|nr:phosphoglucomutase (alpha-D-glucose-1,6-bisphosphate-dependent) [Desulfovibrio piger]
MAVHPHAGKLPAPETLENIPALVSAYYTESPDPHQAAQRVSFGTSGHRGSSLKQTFNERHIHAITQAVCDYRKQHGITGPLFMGGDTHALSEPAFRSALEVLTANDVQVRVSHDGSATATPAVSHAILCWNSEHGGQALADGIIITPSHNPPADGGFKYNPPHGGPAETAVTAWIEKQANIYLDHLNCDVHRLPYSSARRSSLVQGYDFTARYVEDLPRILDMDSIAASGISLGVDPLGGASLSLWEPIAERYKLRLTVVNKVIDPTFRFVPCDKDGKIRMDCSSPYVMSGLLDMRDRFDLAFACDPDSDRHGIVAKSGLMNPNHYLATVAWHLFRSRFQWQADAGIGKTLVTSAMLDRVGQELGRKVIEVPVGFKWFVPYLTDGSCGMGCEESAGASFLCFDGSPWSTDKDGPLLCLLAAEMAAREERGPDEIYRSLTEQFGAPLYQRQDAPADDHVRACLKSLKAEDVQMRTVAGSPVTEILTTAPGNGAAIGGVKVCSRNGWFAIRPSGTEAICKVYAESFLGEQHLHALHEEAQALLQRLLA